jgi:hypothetical protein
VGACLELRVKSRRSARPAFRSRASLLAHPSAGAALECFFFFPEERDSEALARAPKEICSAAVGSGSDSSSEEEFDCVRIREGLLGGLEG